MGWHSHIWEVCHTQAQYLLLEPCHKLGDSQDQVLLEVPPRLRGLGDLSEGSQQGGPCFRRVAYLWLSWREGAVLGQRAPWRSAASIPRGGEWEGYAAQN